ncbi:MAG: HAMP domain-containing protein [Actinobacteria bacterium]|nr:HAMP domain-containing protein [Actinomycetota bacterium]
MTAGKLRFGGKRAGSRILIEIVMLIAVVFMATGIISFLLFRNSQSRLIQESKEKLVEYKALQMCSTSDYVSNLMIQLQMLSVPGSTPQTAENDLNAGINQKTVTPSQQVVADMLKMLVENKFFGSTMALFAVPPGRTSVSKPTIVMSSDEKTVYEPVPGKLVQLARIDRSDNESNRARVDDKNSYALFLEGVPELGLEGAYLVSAFTVESGEMWYFDFAPMHDELAAIDSFYETERARIDLVLGLLMVVSLIILIVMTFLVLSYLVRKTITKPIDELSDAASKVIEGDLDVKVPIRNGEEFEGLKIAFNNMLSSLSGIMSKQVRRDSDGVEVPWIELSEVDRKAPEWRRKGRSLIFTRVTVAVIVLYMAAGALGLLLFQRSQARLVEKSKERIVRTVAESVASGHYFISSLIQRYYTLVIPDVTDSQATTMFFDAISNKTISELQQVMNEGLKGLIDQDFQGLELAFEAFPPMAGIVSEPTVFLSTDDKYMYMLVPERLLNLFNMSAGDNTPYRARLDDDNAYMLARDGFPELGLDGEYLVVAYRHDTDPSTEATFMFFDFKPMGEQLAAIDTFYKNESRHTLFFMGIVTGVGVIAVIIITIFALDYLIRTRITKPIDDLSAVAEQVMDGDLEIRVPVNKGEEFEGIKLAFNEMLISLDEVITKGLAH